MEIDFHVSCVTCIQLSKEKRGIAMQKKSVFYITMVFVLALIILVVNVMQASANNTLAPKPKTPTPTVATSTPPGPTLTPSPTPSAAPTVSSTELTQGWSLLSANNVSDN